MAEKLRTITLELLRHGPPHNQLISNLTGYIALCEDAEAETVYLPFEHREFEKIMRDIGYTRDDGHVNSRRMECRRERLRELGKAMADILGSVPVLVMALKPGGKKSCPLHLRLILNPQELALLPFETSLFPGRTWGPKLLLEPSEPVTITREVRGVPPLSVDWPSEPRVLFAWASPHGAGNVPADWHLLALREALDPWLAPNFWEEVDQTDDLDNAPRNIQRCLTVLPEASLEAIEDACLRDRYTHVHILAHGVPASNSPDFTEIGLALNDHRQRGKMAVARAEDLKQALYSGNPQDPYPRIVTLASCDSGKVKSVVSLGASFAHELHMAKIPVVIASQFPLSVPGSVVFTKEFFKRIFQGEDYRTALIEVRRKLSIRLRNTYDWASLVAYAPYMPNYEQETANIQFAYKKKEVENLIEEAKTAVDRMEAIRNIGDTIPQEAITNLKSKLKTLEDLGGKLAGLGTDKPESKGLQASLHKQIAEVQFIQWQATPEADRTWKDGYLSLTSLEKSRNLYLEAWKTDRRRHWQGVQYLCLTHVLHQVGRIAEGMPDDWWIVTKKMAEEDSNKSKIDFSEDIAWAHGSLMELYLLKSSVEDQGQKPNAFDLALEHCKKFKAALLNMEDQDRRNFVVFSTRRQFSRYTSWWNQSINPENKDATLGEIPDLAGTILDNLPKD